MRLRLFERSRTLGPMARTRTRTVSLPLSVEEHTALLAHADRAGVSVAGACRAALADAGIFPARRREPARRQTTLTIRVTDAQHAALEEHAAAAGTSTADLIRSTLDAAGLFEDTGQRAARSMGGRPPGRKGAAEGTNISFGLTYDERAALESQAAAREDAIAAVVRTALAAAGLFRRRRRRH